MYASHFITACLLTVLTAAAPVLQYDVSAAVSSPPCLNEAEAYLISARWLDIFETDKKGAGTGGAIVETTLAPNFTYYDEGASFGDPAPLYTSANAVYKSVSGSGYSGTLVTNVQYTIITNFASCDTSVVRWQSDSLAADSDEVTVPVGTPVSYKGTDYLQVDLSTRLIYNVTSSSDLINWYIGLGDDVIASELS